jgi:hypothetical protein
MIVLMTICWPQSRRNGQSASLANDPEFTRALDEVERAVDEEDVLYVQAAPLIKALVDSGPLALEQVGNVAGLDPLQVETGLARLEDLGMVSHAYAKGTDVIRLTAAGMAAAV